MTEQECPDDALVTVLVVMFNTKTFFPRLAAALVAQTEERWNLVVFDNASKPDQRLCQEDLPIGARLIQSEINVGFAAGNNLAACSVKTPFLALLNPDAFPEPTWLAELIAAAGRWPNAAAFSSTLIKDADTSRLDGAGDVMHAFGLPYRALHDRQCDAPQIEGETFSACAAAALYRTADFMAVNGFDERYFAYCEDVDLGFRWRLRGRATIHAFRAVARHYGGGSTRGHPDFAAFHGARNRYWTFVKCMPSPLVYILLPLHIAATLCILALHSLRGDGFACWRGFGSAIVGVGPFLRTRSQVQRTRTVDSYEIAKALNWSVLALFKRSAHIRPPAV